MSLFKKYAWYGSAVAASALLAVALLLAGPADKASAATTANNITTVISLNTNAVTGTNTFTTLAPIILTCGAGADITNAGDILLEMTAGTGTFLGGVAPTTSTTGATMTVTSPAVITDLDTITVTVGVADCDAGDTVTITGIQVKPADGDSADGTIVANVAVTDPVAATLDFTNEFYQQTTGSTTPTATGGGVVNIEQSDTGDAFVSATFVATAGTFAANGAATLFCADDNATCDTNTTTGAIAVSFVAPASGTATITSNPAGGVADTIVVTAQSASPAAVSITRTPTAVSSLGGAGNQSAISVTVRNAAGDAIAAAVTATTNLGVLEKTSATACDTDGDVDGATVALASASCTYTSAATEVLSLYGNGAAGTATITITAGNSTTGFATGTTTVTLTGGTPTSLTLELVGSMSATSTPAKSIIRDIGLTTGDSTTDEIIAIARALDANSNAIIPTASANVTFKITDAAGAVVTASLLRAATEESTLQTTPCSVSITDATGQCVDAIEAAAGLAKNGAIALIDNDAVSTAPLAHGVYTVTATWTSGGTTLTATGNFTVAGAADSVALVLGDSTIDVGGSTTATATVLDAEGNPVADGTTVNYSVSSGLAQTSPTTGGVGTTATTTAGVAVVNVLGLAEGSGQVFAIVGTKSGSATLTVGAATPPPPPPGTEGTFDRSIPNVGVNTAVWNGGTVTQLATATTAAGGISVTVFIGGEAIVLIPGAPAFVNAAFNAAFPTGDVPSGTIVLVVR